jgi:hypothetical protein
VRVCKLQGKVVRQHLESKTTRYSFAVIICTTINVRVQPLIIYWQQNILQAAWSASINEFSPALRGGDIHFL